MLFSTHLPLHQQILAGSATHLSDKELLAAFISNGQNDALCLTLAQKILRHFGHIHYFLSSDTAEIHTISQFKLRHFIQLQVARELYKRCDYIHLQREQFLLYSQQTYQFLIHQLRDEKNEKMVAIFLDNHHQFLSYETLLIGTVNSVNLYIRPLIERVLKLNASSIILAHNHPSGNWLPSKQDKRLTKQLQKALAYIDTQLIEHFIIAGNRISSIFSAHCCN